MHSSIILWKKIDCDLSMLTKCVFDECLWNMVMCFSQRKQQTAQTAGWGATEAWAVRETNRRLWKDEDRAGES